MRRILFALVLVLGLPLAAAAQPDPQPGGGTNRADISAGTTAQQTTASTVQSILSAMATDAVGDDPAPNEGPLILGYASNAPPTAVSADGDAARYWVSRTGAMQIAYRDPCASPSVVKSFIEVSSTADEILVPLTSGQTIYVCGFVGRGTGSTTPTFRFLSGTGTACGTSTDVLTGTMPVVATTGNTIEWPAGGSTMFAASVSEDLCIDVGGTSPDIQGVLTYVKQVAQ